MSKIAADTAGFRDYYETLQLNPNADEETINRVFRILVKRYHPDNRDSGNTKKFNEVMDAYRILSDPEKRAAYDVKYDQNRASVLKLFMKLPQATVLIRTGAFVKASCRCSMSHAGVTRTGAESASFKWNVCWDALPSTWNFLSGICGKNPGLSAWKMVSSP